MTVFLHHIYEYKKGLRNLVLYTGPLDERELIEAKLKQHRIAYLLCPLGKQRLNVFFGHDDCVSVVKHMGCDNLSRLTPEHDFMLGIMLGYDRIQQCQRFMQRSQPQNATLAIA